MTGVHKASVTSIDNRMVAYVVSNVDISTQVAMLTEITITVGKWQVFTKPVSAKKKSMIVLSIKDRLLIKGNMFYGRFTESVRNIRFNPSVAVLCKDR